MEPENLSYAAVQVVHNFGVAAVAGGSVVMLSSLWEVQRQRQIAHLVLAGWLTQALSGAGFGAVSLYYYGQLPDIHGIALAALGVKVGCALFGVVLGLAFLRGRWSGRKSRMVWTTETVLGLTALTAAGFLRWFS
ncbi:MAG: hypothetical protein ACREV1_18780 [Gammaproteobacteria bacterium]